MSSVAVSILFSRRQRSLITEGQVVTSLLTPLSDRLDQLVELIRYTNS